MIWVFAAALMVQLAYWLLLERGLSRVRSSQPPPRSGDVPISVIVAARDEVERIPELLAALAEQSCSTFEVVVVDDGSVDGTAEIVAREMPEARIVRMTDPAPPRKKRALARGVHEARHDRLVFTDADCAPRPDWLGTIADYAGTEPDSVLIGYGPLRSRPGALNLLARYETLVTGLLTAASVGLGRPYMAVGRNFSYSRRLFEQMGGFEEHLASLSGDDDLVVQQARRAGAPIRYILEPAAFVESDAPPSWRAWIRQKLRHTSAGRHYDRSSQFHLSVFHASNLGVWIAPLFIGWAGAALLAARFLAQRAVLRRAATAFEAEPDVMVFQPLLDLAYLLYNTILAPVGVFVGGRKW